MEFKTTNKTFIKSHNSVSKIYLNYTIALIGLILFAFLMYLIFGYHGLIFPLFKSLLVSFIITSVMAYIINIIKKDYIFLNIYRDDHVHLIALIIGLCGINTNVFIIALAIFISLVIKRFIKGINVSAALFGILIVILYKYFTNDLVTPLTNMDKITNLATYDVLNITGKDIVPYLVGINYVSPILAVLAFIYLFYKKSIKYSIVLSYIATFTLIMFIYGILNDMSFWFVLFQISCGNILFYSVFLLTDYMRSPTIMEGQVFYGIILGIISAILRFIIPELSVIISIIFGELSLANYFDKISYKFKYNHKLYISLIIISIIFIIIAPIILTIIF